MKHYVLLCRPRFEVALVEVEAPNDRAASVRALEQASESFDGWRLVPFDPQKYGVHIERCRSEADIQMDIEIGGPGEEAGILAEAVAVEPDEDVRYLVAKANIFYGDSVVINQPWLQEETTLMVHDLCDDWIESLEEIKRDALEGVRETEPEPPAGAVVPFRRSGDGDDERWIGPAEPGRTSR